MREQSTKPRRRAPGGGRKPKLAEPDQLRVRVEASDRRGLESLGGDLSEHVRAAIRAYLEARRAG